ncbi:hypothetical protein JTB14_011504 [Gonioctena quinquepunctata]|nr:hypothetical protein JTB14_011504 [Gonioctena quinquepunctata]
MEGDKIRIGYDASAKPDKGCSFLKTELVNDAVVRCKDLSEARRIREQLIQLSAKGGFKLKKFASNNELFFSDLPESHLIQDSSNCDVDSDSIKILDLQWDASHDSFIHHSSPT